MQKDLKDFFFIRSIGFRRMTQRHKFFNVLQLIIDLLIIYESLPLLFQRSWHPAACSLLIIISIILHIAKRNQITNLIGLLLDVIYIFLLAAVVNDGISIAAIGSIIVHLLRIESCYTNERLRTSYGYPHFSPLYMDVELEKDEALAYSVKNEYDDLMDNKVIRFSSAVCRCNGKLQALMITSAIIICIGAVFLNFGANDLHLYNTAKQVDSVSVCHNGDILRGKVYEIYEQRNFTLEKNIPIEYWGVFGGKTIRFSVPNLYKDSFESLYGYYANMYDISSMGNSDSEFADNGILFYGKYTKANDKADLLPITKEKVTAELPDVENEYIIELIDYEKANSRISTGIILMIIGTVGIVAVLLLVFNKLDDYN